MLLFSLTLVSFVMGIIGGEPALRSITDLRRACSRWPRGSPTRSASS